MWPGIARRASIAGPGPLPEELGEQPRHFPCARMIRFERVFNPDRGQVEAYSLTYSDPGPDIQDQCAIALSRRIEDEAVRRDASRAEIKRMWRRAEREGRTLFGVAPTEPDALLLALAPR